MPVRATKRGAERTPLERRRATSDLRRVLRRAGRRARAAPAAARACWSSTATRSASARPRACAAPTAVAARTWGSASSIRQTFGELVVHTPARTYRWRLPWTFSTFDYRAPVRAAGRAGRLRRSRPRRSNGAHAASTVHTDRGDLTRAARRRRAGLAARPLRRGPRRSSRPRRGCRAAWRSTRDGPPRRRPRAVARPRATCAPGYSWSFPAGDELRVGVGSFDPRDHVKEPTVAPGRATSTSPAVALPGQLDPAPAAPPRPRTASSSSATAPATACRRRPRASAPRCTSASPAGASCAPSSRAARTREQALAALRRVLRRARCARSAGCCACRASSRASNPTPLMDTGARADGSAALHRLVLRPLPAHRATRVRARGPAAGDEPATVAAAA